MLITHCNRVVRTFSAYRRTYALHRVEKATVYSHEGDPLTHVGAQFICILKQSKLLSWVWIKKWTQCGYWGNLQIHPIDVDCINRLPPRLSMLDEKSNKFPQYPEASCCLRGFWDNVRYRQYCIYKGRLIASEQSRKELWNCILK